MADELSPHAVAELYTADPGDFLSIRTRLAVAAKEGGDPGLARVIGAQRKPTVGAWIVNRQVHADPSVVERLLDLGTRLRAAHEQLDATVLRELSTERRRLVTDLGTAALEAADRTEAGATLRDDVTDTFDAAVADPQVAARLGRLTRGEKWSGFGVALDAPIGTPELTVLPGGRGPARRAPRKATPAGNRAAATSAPAATSATSATSATEPAPTPETTVDRAEQRRVRRVRDKAADTLAAAEEDLQRSEDAEHSATERVHELTPELERVQADLTTAKHDQERSRQQVKSARSRRREARSALDRAERRAGQAD